MFESSDRGKGVNNVMKSLAELHPPLAFSEIVGQDVVVGALRTRLTAKQKLDCHLTFVGPRGSGKRSLAKIYAQSLVCDERLADGSSCQACAECSAVRALSSFAYIEIDAKIQGDDKTMRHLVEGDALLNTASVRVVVVDNAEHLTMAGADTVLKTMERETETVFLFLVKDLQVFAGALRSRCHVFRVGLVDEAVLERYLASVCDQLCIAYERSALRTIVQGSDGLTGRAVKTLNEVSKLGEVNLANARSALGLGSGRDMLRCWHLLLADRFDESLNAFELAAANDPVRIRAMQAFLCELILRDEIPVRTGVVHLATDLIENDAWTDLAREWDRFAACSSTNGKQMRRDILIWWRRVETNGSASIAFRRGYEWFHGRNGTL